MAANDGNVSVKMEDGTYWITPSGISKSFITPDKLLRVDADMNVVEGPECYKPSSEMKMHMRCYEVREDVGAVVHAHPPTATGFAVANKPLDEYSMIETVHDHRFHSRHALRHALHHRRYRTPSRPILPEHDVLLLQNHGALTVGCDLITAYYRMETLELYAKISLTAHLLGGAQEIPRDKIDQLAGSAGELLSHHRAASRLQKIFHGICEGRKADMMYPKIGIRPVIDGRWGGIRESLEEQTMGMAHAAKALIETLQLPGRHAGAGASSRALHHRRRRGGRRLRGEVLRAERGGHPDRDPLLVLRHRRPSTWTPLTIKAVWGFNGTERPGAVYLAAVLAAHAQKGLPAFSIYGHDVQDTGDTHHSRRRGRRRFCALPRCAVAVGWMKNKSYVNMGGVAMGIAGSYCDAGVFQKYFGIRAEWVDMAEIVRRMTLEHLRPRGIRKGPRLGQGQLPRGLRHATRARTCLRSSPSSKVSAARQGLGVHHQDDHDHPGHPVRQSRSWTSWAGTRRRWARTPWPAGFQGQRQWTDWLPNGGLYRGHHGLHLRLERPQAAHALCHGERHAATAFPCCWARSSPTPPPASTTCAPTGAPRPCERVTGWKPEGVAANGFIHLINSGATALDGTGAAKNENGEHVHEALLGYDRARTCKACLDGHRLVPGQLRVLPRRRLLQPLPDCTAEMPVTMLRAEHRGRRGPGAADRRGLDRQPAR